MAEIFYFSWWTDTLVQVPDCFLLMHFATQSVRIGYTGAAQDAIDVYCICGCVDPCVADHANGCGSTCQLCHHGPPLACRICVFIDCPRGGRVLKPGRRSTDRGGLFLCHRRLG